MKRKIINKKLISGVVITTLLLSGCAKKEEKEQIPETVVVVETVIVTPTPTPTLKPTPKVIETTTESTTELTTHETIKPSETTTTSIVETNSYGHEVGGLDANLDSLYDGINYINDKIDNFDYNEVKDSTIEYAKELIDFIFYGGEMNGITFDELKEEGKQEAYEELQEIDAIIMQFFPDYKEQLGEKYNKVKDFASTTLDKAKEIFSGNDVDVDIDININSENNKKKVLTLNNKDSE